MTLTPQQQEEMIKNAADSLERLADGIRTIAEAFRKISGTALKRKCIINLIQLNTKPRMSIGDIENVLDSIETLESNFLKPKEKTPGKQ